MQARHWFKQPFPIPFSQKSRASFGFACKCSTIFIFFLFSILIVACGSSATASNVNLGAPPVTVTINLNGNNFNSSSPTPTLPTYWCGAWATDTSPILGTTVGVYAKYTQNVAGNPVGVEGATATATVTWPDGTTSSQTVTTTKDGLAVFYVPTTGQTDALGQITYVTVSFQASGTPGCQVASTQAAYFTVMVVSPTPTGAPTKTPGH